MAGEVLPEARHLDGDLHASRGHGSKSGGAFRASLFNTNTRRVPQKKEEHTHIWLDTNPNLNLGASTTCGSLLATCSPFQHVHSHGHGSKSQAHTPRKKHPTPTTKIKVLKWVVNSPNPTKMGYHWVCPRPGETTGLPVFRSAKSEELFVGGANQTKPGGPNGSKRQQAHGPCFAAQIFGDTLGNSGGKPAVPRKSC